MEQLLLRILSNDNESRIAAEASFNQLKEEQPEQAVSGLMECLMTSQNHDVRGLVAVLLRTSLFKPKWFDLSAPLQQRVKGALLQILAKEPNASTRHKLVDTICELAGQIFNRAEQEAPESGPLKWPELLPFVFQAATHEMASHRDTGLRVITRLSAFLGPLLKGPHVTTLKQIFARGLVDADPGVRISALSATISFVELHFDEAAKKEIQRALPQMAEIIGVALKNGNEDDARQALGMFVELATADPLFFKPSIGPLTQLMAKVISTVELEDETRQYALEFLVTLCEEKPGMMGKIPNFFPELVKLCIGLLLEMEHDDGWFDRLADSVELTNFDVASEALDRLCLTLTGKRMMPIFKQLLPILLKNPDWKQRFAGLHVICVMGEGCVEEVGDDLPGLLSLVVPFFKDPHPRVRYAAFNTLGQLCTDFGPAFQEELHGSVLPALLDQLEMEKVPKVLSHVCACAVNWCEDLDPIHLVPYLDRWMTALQRILREGHPLAQEMALVAVAALGECLQERFIPYYDGFMPLCKAFMGTLPKEQRRMQGKCIDLITVMAASVGPGKFAADAQQILPAMVQLQQSNLAIDDPLVSHLMQGWARICSCLKEGFLPYLNVVLPPLLAAAARKPDVQYATADNSDKLQSEGVWDFRSVSDENFAVRTSDMDEKALAINMIYCYAKDLKHHFFPCVKECANIVVPLVNFYLDQAVRGAACGCIPKLIDCVVLHAVNGGGAASAAVAKEMWAGVYPVLLESINAEPDVQVLGEKVECLDRCLKALGPGSLTGEQLQAGLSVLMGVILSVLERKERMIVRREEEDFDETEANKLETENEWNEKLLEFCSDLHCQFIKTLPEAYMALLTKLTVGDKVLVQLIVELVTSPITFTDLQIAICMMDDVIEFGGPSSTAMYQQFMPVLVGNVKHNNPAVRQAAIYGVGVFLQVAPPAAVNPQMCNELLVLLNSVITAPKSRSKHNANATENAISAFGKALEFRGDMIQDEKGAVESWVRMLPVSKDRIEARRTHARLVQFLSSNRKFIWGTDLALLPHILNILVQILGSKLVEDPLNPQIVTIIKGIQTFPKPAVEAAVQKLDPALRKKLQEIN